MTFTSEQRRALEDLRKEYRIFFSKDTSQGTWSPSQRHIFEAVQKLGQIKYDDYAANEDDGGKSEPWKYQAKQLAKRLTEKAVDCVRRNEASWRYACEPLVFTRFGAEVACPNCRKRVWRSTIEATPFSNDRKAEQLRSRQRKREPCCCPRNTRPQDMEEAIGLNRIFIDRAQDPVIHDRKLRNKLPKGEQPDRIYGLRETRNFENMLYALHEENKLVRDIINPTPLSPDGHPLLFPFLVVEAKSSTSTDDWYSIKLQTAFPIYTFLETQQSLQLATGQKSKWKSEPLVWFFMSKGEDWGLCAAFRKDRAPAHGLRISSETHIVELWRGCIETRDSALQLFLIVDYICDWARDIYRPAVLNELKILSSPDTCEIQTVYTDSDIYSLRGTFYTSNDERLDQNEEGQDRRQAAFHALDSPNGMVRHASFIESRFYTLLITSDNVSTLLQSTPEKAVVYFSRQILGQLKDKSILLEPKHLAAIENQWTGVTGIPSRFSLTQSEFYSVITFNTYMTVSWQQVRDLCIIAVAKDAFDTLVVASGLRRGRGNTRSPLTFDLNKDSAVAAISHLKSSSVRHNLLAAISRVALRIDNLGSEGRKSSYLCTDDAITWELVHYVYKSFQKGRLEPKEPFLRSSKRMDNPSIDSSDEGPFRFAKNLSVSSAMAVLIHGKGHSHDVNKKQQSSLCVYFFNESLEAPNKHNLAAAIKETFEDHDVYHTTRDNGRLNIKAAKESKAPWNLKRTYGVHFSYGGQSFIKWLRSLDADLPTRQGSPRYRSSSGSYLLYRQYSPWHDRRRIYGGPLGSMRKQFLEKLIAFEFGFWRKIAQKRYEEGVQCCACCAEILEGVVKAGDYTYEITCDNCHKKLRDPKFPQLLEDEVKKGLENRNHYNRGDRLFIEVPTEYTIPTPEPSPFRARMEHSSALESSEDSSTDDLFDSSDETNDSGALGLDTSSNTPMASPHPAAESSRKVTAVSQSRKRKRSGSEAV